LRAEESNGLGRKEDKKKKFPVDTKIQIQVTVGRGINGKANLPHPIKKTI
jgi:hypothetical protein